MPEPVHTLASEPTPSDPARTCAGCRQTSERASLVRLAASVGGAGQPVRLVPDLRGKLGGRGVSIHASRRCVSQAVHRGGFARALSAAVDVDEAVLTKAIETQLVGRATGLLLGGLRAKKVELGTEAVARTLESGSIELLLVARDAAGRSTGLAERTRALGKGVVVFGDKARLGGLASRGELGVLAILDRGIAREIERVSTLLDTLAGDTDVSGGASPSKSEAEAE